MVSLTARHARRPEVEAAVPQRVEHVLAHPVRVAPALVVRPAKHRERGARDGRAPRGRYSDAQGQEHPAQRARRTDGEAAGGDGPLGLVGGVLCGGAGRALVGDAALQEVQPYPGD